MNEEVPQMNEEVSDELRGSQMNEEVSDELRGSQMNEEVPRSTAEVPR
jgi:hypothetical protein